MCLPEKKAMLLSFSGVDLDDPSEKFDFDSYMSVAKIPDNNFSKALVRYLNHIKITYTPNQPLEAKAYPGVRLFGRPHTQDYYDTQMIF